MTTTTKRGRAPSAAVAASTDSPLLAADKTVNGKHLALKKKRETARGRRNSNGDDAAREPPPAPLLSSSSSPSSSFWSSVERDALAALVAPEPVDSFLAQIDNTIRQPQLDIDLGVSRQKLRDDRGQIEPPEQERCVSQSSEGPVQLLVAPIVVTSAVKLK